MKRSYYHLFLLYSILWLLVGCGKIGDPSVPVVPQPLPVNAVLARVAEDGIVLAWSPPNVYDTEKPLELEDIKYFSIFRKVEPPLDTGWYFNQSSEGWTVAGQSLVPKQYNGVLRTASDQKLLTILSQEDLNLNAAENRFIRVRLWTRNAEQGYIAFITNNDTRWDKDIDREFEPAVHSSYYAVHQTFDSSKLKRFPIRQSASPVAQEYVIDMESIPAWDGIIRQIGLIVQNNSPEENLVEIGLDSVEFMNDIDAPASSYNRAPWVFLDDEEGWQSFPTESLFGAAQGVLYAEEDGVFSLLSAPGQRIRFDEASTLQVSMKATAGDEAYLILRRGGEKFFRSAKELADAASRGIRIPLQVSSDFSTYMLDLSHYIEALTPSDSELQDEPETVSGLHTDAAIEEKGLGDSLQKKQDYFTQIGFVFPAVPANKASRRILIDYIDILSEGADSELNASRLVQRAIPPDDEIARDVQTNIKEKRSAFALSHEELPGEQEDMSGERVQIAQISPAEPAPAEHDGERFVLKDSGQFVVEREDGQEMTAALEYGNSYTYEIEVTDRKKRKSTVSDAISIEFMRAPSPPKNVSAEAGDERVTLTWDSPLLTEDGKKIRNLGAYHIFRSSSAGEYADTPFSQVPASQTYFVDTTVKNRETYYYVVRALASQSSESGSSKSSSEVSATPLDISAPEAPGGLVGVYLDDTVNLHWNQVPTADFAGFNVYRSNSPDGEFQKLNDELVRKSSYSDETVEVRKRYYYYVTALDDEVPPNESEPSILKPIETYPLD